MRNLPPPPIVGFVSNMAPRSQTLRKRGEYDSHPSRIAVTRKRIVVKANQFSSSSVALKPRDVEFDSLVSVHMPSMVLGHIVIFVNSS